MLNTCSIGRRWKSREGWSRPVLTGERGTLFPIPLGDWVSSCGGFLVGWQGILFLVVTTMLVRRLSLASVVRFPDRHDRNRSCGWFRCRPIPVGGWPSCIGFAVVMAQVRRPVPFRTRKLRPGTAMVLHSRGCGRVARRRIQLSGPSGRVPWGIPGRSLFLFSWGFPPGATPRKPPFFVFLPDFSGPSRTSRQRLSGSSKVFFRGLRPSRSSGPPGRASMTPRRVLLLSGAYRRTRVAGDPFFSHDRSDWMVGCGSKLDASLFSNVVQDLQHSIAILLFADVACGMQYPDLFIPFRPHASQFFSAAYPRATNTGLPPSSSSSSLNPLRFSSTRFGSFLSVFSTSPELVSW